ncbi:hypothetical protein [Spirosoma fluminis]
MGDPFIKPWMIDRADDHYELNIDKARQQLNWQPRYTLMIVLPTIIENVQAHPVVWHKENGPDLPEALNNK